MYTCVGICVPMYRYVLCAMYECRGCGACVVDV